MTKAQRDFLGSALRWVLMLLVARLMRGHALPGAVQQLLGPAIDDAVEQLLAGAVAIGTLAWSWAQKRAAQLREQVALALPPSSTPADVTAVLKVTNPGLTKVP